MASTLRPCGICGAMVRFPGDATEPSPCDGPMDGVICEKPECQAELARRERVNTPPEPVDDKPGNGPKKDKAKK